MPISTPPLSSTARADLGGPKTDIVSPVLVLGEMPSTGSAASGACTSIEPLTLEEAPRSNGWQRQSISTCLFSDTPRQTDAPTITVFGQQDTTITGLSHSTDCRQWLQALLNSKMGASRVQQLLWGGDSGTGLNAQFAASSSAYSATSATNHSESAESVRAGIANSPHADLGAQIQ